MKKTYGKQKQTIDQMYSNRQIADSHGHLFYFTGEPCVQGHNAPRYVSNGTCYECMQIYKKRYEKKKYPQKPVPSKYLLNKIKNSNTQYGVQKLTVKEMKSSAEEAVEAGHSYYFTGKYCRNGHLAPRRVNNSTCFECDRIYSRNYRKKKQSHEAKNKHK